MASTSRFGVLGAALTAALVGLACGSESSEFGNGSGRDGGTGDGGGEFDDDFNPGDGERRLERRMQARRHRHLRRQLGEHVPGEGRDANIVFPAFADRLRQIGAASKLPRQRAGRVPIRRRSTRRAPAARNFHGGKAWMDSSSPALNAEFKCVGDISSSGSECSGSNDDERPISAATAALEAAATAEGKPTHGFSRDDALLVVIAITDEDETPHEQPAQTAQQIYDRLIAVKGGDVRRMVLLGIGGASDCSGEYGDADNAVLLKSVTDLFVAQGRGVFWDLCGGKLEDGLGAAMQVIERACNDLPKIR